MATRRKRNINFLPADTRPEPVIDISAYPVDIGVGELMRLTRERLGHELQSVANQLRIRLSYLEAIEESRFRDLPGTTYAIGFVRSYADYLGLDGPDVVRRFREEAARIHGRTKLIFPALTVEGKIPRSAVLLLSVAGLALAYVAWYLVSSWRDTEVPVIAEVPDRLIALTPAPESEPAVPLFPEPAPALPAPPLEPDGSAVPSPPQIPATGSGAADTSAGGSPIMAAPEDGAAIASPEAPDLPAEEALPLPEPGTALATPTALDIGAADPATPGAEAPAEPTAEAAVPQVPAPAESPSDGTITVEAIPPAPSLPQSEGPEDVQQAALAGGARNVVLEARMESWVEVRDADGKRIFSQTLLAGQRYGVPDVPGLTLKTGNAGGLDVTVGGRKAPPLGDVGDVVDKIALDPDRLLSGTAGGP